MNPPPPTPQGHGAIGIVSRGAELLLVRRAAHLRAGGHWCFPGGHVEPGESTSDAVVRELREELGIEVVAREHLGVVTVVSPSYALDVWTVDVVTGEMRPAPEEIAEWRWVLPADVGLLRPGMTSNAGVLALLARR